MQQLKNLLENSKHIAVGLQPIIHDAYSRSSSVRAEIFITFAFVCRISFAVCQNSERSNTFLAALGLYQLRMYKISVLHEFR